MIPYLFGIMPLPAGDVPAGGLPFDPGVQPSSNIPRQVAIRSAGRRHGPDLREVPVDGFHDQLGGVRVEQVTHDEVTVACAPPRRGQVDDLLLSMIPDLRRRRFGGGLSPLL